VFTFEAGKDVRGSAVSSCAEVIARWCCQLIQHLSEKYDFRVSPFCHVVQKHELFEVAY